jgi:TPR repeat protein
LFWKIAVPVACVVLICGAAIARHTYKAKAHERKFAEAVEKSRLRAGQGDAKAEYQLGGMYYYGRGEPQDYNEALGWYRKAADQGDMNAEDGLGYMYSQGQGVPQDYAEALRWYRKAADQGDAKTEEQLGYMYSQDKGVPQDYAEAFRWYRKAAEQGDAGAEVRLAYMYSHGQGVAQDYAGAFRWYGKAADQGNATGQDGLGYMYANGYGVRQDSAEAFRWYRKAAGQGDKYALHALSVGLTGLRKFTLLLQLLWGLCLTFDFLSFNFLVPSNGFRDFRQRVITGMGVACLFLTGLSWYGYTHDKIRCLRCGFNTFTLFKWVLDVVFIALLIYILRSVKKAGIREDSIDSSESDVRDVATEAGVE